VGVRSIGAQDGAWPSAARPGREPCGGGARSTMSQRPGGRAERHRDGDGICSGLCGGFGGGSALFARLKCCISGNVGYPDVVGVWGQVRVVGVVRGIVSRKRNGMCLVGRGCSYRPSLGYDRSDRGWSGIRFWGEDSRKWGRAGKAKEDGDGNRGGRQAVGWITWPPWCQGNFTSALGGGPSEDDREWSVIEST